MQQVDFYLIQSSTEQQRVAFACQLVAKAYSKGVALFVFTENQTQALAFDHALWVYDDRAFIPHQLVSGKYNKESVQQVYISAELPSDFTGTLINLSQTQIPETHSCERLIEISVNTPESRQHARQLYKHYQQQAIPLQHHSLQY